MYIGIFKNLNIFQEPKPLFGEKLNVELILKILEYLDEEFIAHTKSPHLEKCEWISSKDEPDAQKQNLSLKHKLSNIQAWINMRIF